MVFYECLVLQKPFIRYSKDQHCLFVCQGGERPPLEPPSATSLCQTSSQIPLYSPSTSLSSIPSMSTASEDSISYEHVSYKPIQELLKCSWHQDVSKRYTIKEVCHALEQIMDGLNNGNGDIMDNLLSIGETEERNDASNTTKPTGLFSCFSSIGEYDIRDAVMDFATELQELGSTACFGARLPSSPDAQTTCNTIEQPEIDKVNHQKQVSKPDQACGNGKVDETFAQQWQQLPGHSVFSFSVPGLSPAWHSKI
jgi:hypothetical protein